MHIPDSMLQGSVCPVTAVMSAAGIAAAAYLCHKSKDRPTAASFGAITALIFAGQMMNFPIMNGTSGHLLGGVLAASLLGTPFGVLSIALVVAIQSLFFSDGGVTVLGANILNMAILGAGVGGVLRSRLAAQWKGAQGKYLATASAAWFSVVLASLAVGIQLAIDGQIPFLKVVPAMVGTHALIGVGEALITCAAYALFSAGMMSKKTNSHVIAPLTSAVVVSLLLSPFASGFPDGLEWIAEKYNFLHESAPAFVGPLSDYAVPSLSNEAVSTGVAGLAGVVVSFAAAWITVRILQILAAKRSVA